MRTGINAKFTSGAFYRVDDNNAIVTFIDSFRFAIGDAWRIVAMITEKRNVTDLDVGTWPRTVSVSPIQNCPVSGCGFA